MFVFFTKEIKVAGSEFPKCFLSQTHTGKRSFSAQSNCFT